MGPALQRDGTNERPLPPWPAPLDAAPLGAEPVGGAEPASIYLHARYYDPLTGVFLSPDPMGPVGGLNSFGYSGGNPANFADRSGLCHDGYYVGDPDEHGHQTLICPTGDVHENPGDQKWNGDFWAFLMDLFPIVGGFENNVFAHLLAKREALAANKAAREAERAKDDETTTKQTTSTCGGDGQSACEIPTCQGSDCPRFNQLIAAATVVSNTPITPGSPYSVRDVSTAAAAEGAALALDAFARAAPCGQVKQGAHYVAATGHGAAAARLGVVALVSGAAALALAPETGGLSFAVWWEALVAGVAGGGAVHMGTEAYVSLTEGQNSLCPGQ